MDQQPKMDWKLVEYLVLAAMPLVVLAYSWHRGVPWKWIAVFEAAVLAGGWAYSLTMGRWLPRYLARHGIKR